MNAVGQRFELEADRLGSFLAKKAGYDGAFSALRKMNTDIFGDLLDEHPPVTERIRYIIDNPVVEYDRRQVSSEYLFISDLEDKIINDNVSSDDFMDMLLTEHKYISEAHMNLEKTKSFMYQRKFELEKTLKEQNVINNVKLHASLFLVLRSYDKAIRDTDNIIRIGLLRKDAEEMLVGLRELRSNVRKNYKHSLKNSLRRVTGKEKERGSEDNENCL